MFVFQFARIFKLSVYGNHRETFETLLKHCHRNLFKPCNENEIFNKILMPLFTRI